MEGALGGVGREFNHWITIDVQRLRTGERSFHAFNEVIAVGFEFLLTVEIETRIVIDPADQVDVGCLALNKEVSRIRAVVTRRRLFRFLRNPGNEHRKASQFGIEVDPATGVRLRSGSNGRRSWAGRCGWWPSCMFLRTRGEAKP